MATQESSVRNFGLIIAYIIPGFATLWGASYLSAPLWAWLTSPAAGAQTLAGLLYSTIASIGVGVTVSTVRWMSIDPLHHATGIRPPRWDFSQLRDGTAAFDMIVEHYYRYYQFHANTLIALFFVFFARRGAAAAFGLIDLALVALMGVHFVGSRDSLRRYYTRGGQLLRSPPGSKNSH